MSDVAGRQLEVQIKDDGSVLYDLRKKINFKGFSVEATADELKLSTDAPMRPQITSPSNGAVDVNVLTRISASAYYHIHGIPIGGSHWQIATDANFTQIVMDRTQYSGDYQTVVTSDENGAILSPAIKFYARVRYFDVRDTYSQWSDPISFTTISVPAVSAILEPVILSPAQNGTLPVGTMYLRLSDPEIIGSTLIVNQMEIQVSSTPQFEPADLYKTYLVNHPYFHYEKDPTLEQIASPFFIRARQKDTVNGAASPWSNHIAVNISKYYNGDVIGFCHHAFGTGYYGGSNLMSRGITIMVDESEHQIAVTRDWFDKSPIFSGISSVKIRDKLGVDHDMVFIPPFFVKAKTVEIKPPVKINMANVSNTTSNSLPVDDEKKIYVWISPTKKDDTWYLHPMFQQSPAGVFISAALISHNGTNYVSEINRPAVEMPGGLGQTVGKWVSLFDALETNDYSFAPWNTAIRAGLHLLMAMHYGSINLFNQFTGLYGINNDAASVNWKGIYSISKHQENNPEDQFTGSNFTKDMYRCSVCLGAKPGYIYNISSPAEPFNPTTLGVAPPYFVGYTDGTMFGMVEQIWNGGHEDILGYPIEVMWVPQSCMPYNYGTSIFGCAFNKYASGIKYKSQIDHVFLEREFNFCGTGGMVTNHAPNANYPTLSRMVAFIK